MNFACDRCAKAYTLADAKVPAFGFRFTCRRCGNVFTVTQVAPSRSAPVTGGAPSLPRHEATVDAHERFFDSAPASHHPGPASAEPRAPGGPTPSRLPLALGVVAVAGVLAGGLWWAGHAAQGGAAPGSPVERAGGGPAGSASQSPGRGAGAGAREASPVPPAGLAVLPPDRPQARRPGPAIQKGEPVRARPVAGAGDSLGGSGAPLGKREKRLLDLLDRKQDSTAIAAPPPGELNPGRATLDEATVRGALATNSGAFAACIDRAGKFGPGSRAGGRTLVMELVVRPTGRVSEATVTDSRYAGTALAGCLVAAARRMVFPTFEGEEIRVEAPLKLSVVQ